MGCMEKIEMSEHRTRLGALVDNVLPAKSRPVEAPTSVEVSWNGTSSVPSGVLEKALFERFKEMRGTTAPEADSKAAPDTHK